MIASQAKMVTAATIAPMMAKVFFSLGLKKSSEA
jgi:hypothetical protein